MTKRFIVLIFSTITLVSCTNNSQLSSDMYSISDTKQAQSVTYGTLMKVRHITIQSNEDSNVIGAIGGAVLGGFLGNTVGRGSGRSLATAAGAIAGSVAGSNLEDSAYKVPGLELEVRKDDGTTILVVQKQGKTIFKIRQRVAIVSNGHTVTVSPR